MFSAPVKLTDAARLNAVKTILPTSLNSTQLAALGPDFHRRALVSARLGNASVLDTIYSGLQSLLKGNSNVPEQRLAIQRALAASGYQAPADKEGTLQDFGSRARQDLILETNLATARGYGQFVVANDPDLLDGFPAWELVRDESRDVPRGSDKSTIGWERRWMTAAQASGDGKAGGALTNGGRMVALKNSPIWNWLGDTGLFPDGLGNPYPPFAFNSGMGVEEVDREDAVSLGLIDADTPIEPADLPGFNENFEASPAIANTDILNELIQSLGDFVKLSKGVLTIQ